MTSVYCHLLLLATLLLLSKKQCCAEIFTASTDVASMFSLEEQVVNILKDLVSRTESKLEVIQRYLADYESVVKEKMDNDDEEFFERVAGNPIHAYRLMKRLYFVWQTIENDIMNDDWKNAVNHLKNIKLNARFPKEEDFFGAVQAVIRLQDTYELNMTQLGLTAQDCFLFGQTAVNAGFYARGVEWLEQSYILAGNKNNETVHQDTIMSFTQYAINMHDLALKANSSLIQAELILFPLPLNEQSAAVQRNKIIRTRKYTLGKADDVNTTVDDINNFNALCRGESILREEVVSKLKCWYDDRHQPYFRLMPIRVEQHSSDPVVYTFHNILSDKEIERLIEFAKPRLNRTGVNGDGVYTESDWNISIDYQISKSAWLSDSLDPLIKIISNRISFITGLSTDPFVYGAEALQMANYGIGGHYYPHYDYLMEDSDEIRDDRIATFMFYLNEVEQGGATVFPRAGAAVRPTKGSAAFWYNLKRSGEKDPMTLHGACPILFSHKWVGNKWIHEAAQFFHRPCTLNPNE